jgi:hypothetical protein
LIKHQIAVERKILTSAGFAGVPLKTVDATALNEQAEETIGRALGKRELR